MRKHEAVGAKTAAVWQPARCRARAATGAKQRAPAVLRGGRLNPPEEWVWSEEPAHEALASREMFDKANLTAIKADNVTKAKDGHDDYRTHTYVLRSFLRCGVCGLRMLGNVRRRQNGAYYTCDLNRRQASLVPEDHPRAV